MRITLVLLMFLLTSCASNPTEKQKEASERAKVNRDKKK